MRLKYQLRGLGIGIILTAALLMIFSDDGEASAKTDSEMIVASTEAEATEETVEVESSVVLPEETVVQEEASIVETEEVQTEITTSEEETASETTEEASVEESVEETTTEAASTEIESTEAESTETVVNEADMVTIKIISGDDSGTVARKLQTAGLVDNASEYDAYLMQHGYDKRISVGEVKIKLGSSWLEIAEKISGK